MNNVLWVVVADKVGRLICYHSPKDIIVSYDFDVELVAQEMTAMHGSKEPHNPRS